MWEVFTYKIDWIKAQKVQNPPHTGLALTGSTCALSLGQFDLRSLGQIALGTVLPFAWLQDQISLRKFDCTGLV